MSLRYKRFYYDIDKLNNDASIFVDEVLVLKKVITFTNNPSELFSDEIHVFKVNSVMEFKNKTDRKIIDPFNFISGRSIKPEQILKLYESMNYLPLDYRLMSVTELKLNSLRKVVGDKAFVDETDVFPYDLPLMTRCYDGVDFQYKDTNGKLIRYFGKFFVINDSGYILSAAYMKQPEAPNAFNLYALAATHPMISLSRSIQNVDVCELSDIKFDDMLSIYKEDAFFYYDNTDYTIRMFNDGKSHKTCGFLISNIERVDTTELDEHFSYRIKGRFVNKSSSLNSLEFKSEISYGFDIGSAIDLEVDKSFATLELGDIDDVKRVYANEFKFESICLLDGLFYVRLVELCDGEKHEHPIPIVWPIYTVYRQFMRFDRIRRKAIDDYIDKLSDEELACIGPDNNLFGIE